MPSSQRPEYQTAAARIFPTKGHAVTMTTFQGGEIQGKHPFLLFADGINLESISFGRRRLRLHSDRKDERTDAAINRYTSAELFIRCLKGFPAWGNFYAPRDHLLSRCRPVSVRSQGNKSRRTTGRREKNGC